MSQEPAKGENDNGICSFCRTNDPDPARIQHYTGHLVKALTTGKVTCPVLRKYVCPFCGATGDNAHTARYCKQFNTVDLLDVRKLKTTRNSCKSCTALIYLIFSNSIKQVCYNLNSVAFFSKKSKVSIPKLTVDGSNNN